MNEQQYNIICYYVNIIKELVVYQNIGKDLLHKVDNALFVKNT